MEHLPHARPATSPPLARVLLVEDDPELRAALSELLALEGYEVIATEHALDALLHLRTALPEPDAVILDLGLSVMSGREFREAQLAEPTIAGVPVIALSAGPLDGLGFDTRIEKPCTPGALLDALRRILTAPGRAGGRGSTRA